MTSEYPVHVAVTSPPRLERVQLAAIAIFVRAAHWLHFAYLALAIAIMGEALRRCARSDGSRTRIHAVGT
jgi:hypothetical protein